MGRQSWKTWKIEKCKKIKFKKIVKNRKKQNFTDLTQNPVTTFLLSKRKHSWLFFEIGIENGFLGGGAGMHRLRVCTVARIQSREG